MLNLICEAGSASQERIFEIMRTFVGASSHDEIIRHLRECGWIEPRGDEVDRVVFQLTEEGQRQHKNILARQKDIRQRAIRVLQQLVRNLEGDLDA